MPWKASSVMEERLRFVARLLDGTRPRETPLGIGHDRACPPALPVQRRAQRMRPANNSASRTCDPLRHAAACHVRHRRMSERVCQRFTAIRQLMLGPACARELSFHGWFTAENAGTSGNRSPFRFTISTEGADAADQTAATDTSRAMVMAAMVLESPSARSSPSRSDSARWPEPKLWNSARVALCQKISEATRLSDDLRCYWQPPRRRPPSRGVLVCRRHLRFFRQLADTSLPRPEDNHPNPCLALR
jgi:hypothetical protein